MTEENGTTDSELYVCTLCGAVVGNRYWHTQWHAPCDHHLTIPWDQTVRGRRQADSDQEVTNG